ncbi:MAG: hypothetical protein CMI56_00855 [Parcubacteria group bacterium]|nr:hypothetical protein [Parcubacteria group bacterium]|tara:strand:+ start:300 stop:728 length:429 start_codon:yes stop_codon:yes gene_type:complete
MEDTRSLKQKAWDYQLQLDARAAWLEGQEIQKRRIAREQKALEEERRKGLNVVYEQQYQKQLFEQPHVKQLQQQHATFQPTMMQQVDLRTLDGNKRVRDDENRINPQLMNNYNMNNSNGMDVVMNGGFRPEAQQKRRRSQMN